MLTYLISSFIANVFTSLLLTKLKCQMHILPPPPLLVRLEEVSHFVFFLFVSLLLTFVSFTSLFFCLMFFLLFFDLTCPPYGRHMCLMDIQDDDSMIVHMRCHYWRKKEQNKTKKAVIGNDKMYLGNIQGKIKRNFVNKIIVLFFYFSL